MGNFTPTDEGLCGVCEETVRLRRDGRPYAHPRPTDPDAPIVFTIVDGRALPVPVDCPGARQQAAVRLEMSFARWLRAHHTRRDGRENAVTFLAQRVFQACTRTPAKTVAELDWSSAGELRLRLVQPGVNDWLGEYVDAAEAGFEAYSAARAQSRRGGPCDTSGGPVGHARPSGPPNP
jgi:hypothetical protein